MNDTFLDQSEKAVAYLPQHFDSLFLWMLQAWPDIAGKVTIAQLLDDVIVFAALHDIIKTNHIL
jgi:hypothetical protein